MKVNTRNVLILLVFVGFMIGMWAYDEFMRLLDIFCKMFE